MWRQQNFSTASLSLTFITLIVGTILFAEYAWTQQSATERAAWNVQLGRNVQAKSQITIQNQCKRKHSFTITKQQVPFLQFQGAQTVSVPGNRSYDLPVLFNTNGMNAGQYQGNVEVKCNDCGKEKGCTQDREIIPVRLTVLQEDGPQMTPENPTQPQVPGSPVLKQDAQGGGTVAKPTPMPTPTPTPTPTPIPTPTPMPTPAPPPPPTPTDKVTGEVCKWIEYKTYRVEVWKNEYPSDRRYLEVRHTSAKGGGVTVSYHCKAIGIYFFTVLKEGGSPPDIVQVTCK